MCGMTRNNKEAHFTLARPKKSFISLCGLRKGPKEKKKADKELN